MLVNFNVCSLVFSVEMITYSARVMFMSENFTMQWLIITSWVFLISSAASSLVTIDQGTLNGTLLRARNGKLFNAFYGIPFAKPPVGKLRFKAPVAAEPWDGILNATRIPTGCLELADDGNGTKGVEDCLNLNVFTPLNARKGDNIPVLFYIFGGIFKSNSNMDEGPQYLMSRDLIIVIANYRLGSLGFLSTGDDVISGNYGLKDQLLALKWTRDNIHNFGGDPNQITMNGHSSGAVSAHLHTLSPASKGLFQRVILQSGAAFCSLSYWGPDVARAVTKEFAMKAGCPSVASSRDMYECFMTLDKDLFVTVPEEMYIWDEYPDAAFRPTVESVDVEDAFITDMPKHLKYHSPELPLLIGLTTGEGAGIAAAFLNNSEKTKTLDKFYQTLFPITLQYLWNTKEKNLKYVTQILKTHYFGETGIGVHTADEMVQLFTHGIFGVCVVDAIHSYPGPKYVYWYDYKANYISQNERGFYDEFLGISHSDEVNLIFLTEKSVDVLNDRDIMFSDELGKRWVNFILTSNPNYPYKINTTIMDFWEPAVSERLEYLMMNINGTMETDLYKKTYPFWQSLPIGNKYFAYKPS